MPEGDTIWLSARRLHDALAGHVLVQSDFRVPRYATADVTGRRVLEVVSRGKHLLARFDDGTTLHTHCEMDGTWRLFRPGAPWHGGAAHQVRVVLATESRVAVAFRMPVIDLLPTAQEDRVVGHLGPDCLGPDWDADEVVRRLAAQPERQLGPALLDQRNLAGVGNLYKCEALFLRGVSPWTRVGDVPDLRALVTLAQRLLEANKRRWEQITTGDTRPGRQTWVFERAGRSCLRCRGTVRVAEQAEPDAPLYARITYWCPSCQPGPGPPPEPGRH